MVLGKEGARENQRRGKEREGLSGSGEGDRNGGGLLGETQRARLGCAYRWLVVATQSVVPWGILWTLEKAGGPHLPIVSFAGMPVGQNRHTARLSTFGIEDQVGPRLGASFDGGVPPRPRMFRPPNGPESAIWTARHGGIEAFIPIVTITQPGGPVQGRDAVDVDLLSPGQGHR